MPVTRTTRTVTTRDANGELMTTQTVEETVETYDFPVGAVAPVPAPTPGQARREQRQAERAARVTPQPPVTEAQVVEAKAAMDGAKDL